MRRTLKARMYVSKDMCMQRLRSQKKHRDQHTLRNTYLFILHTYTQPNTHNQPKHPPKPNKNTEATTREQRKERSLSTAGCFSSSAGGSGLCWRLFETKRCSDWNHKCMHCQCPPAFLPQVPSCVPAASVRACALCVRTRAQSLLFSFSPSRFSPLSLLILCACCVCVRARLPV